MLCYDKIQGFYIQNEKGCGVLWLMNLHLQ
nr:MAG TPA: hypothetical protein [Caudoviricetes sp.]